MLQRKGSVYVVMNQLVAVRIDARNLHCPGRRMCHDPMNRDTMVCMIAAMILLLLLLLCRIAVIDCATIVAHPTRRWLIAAGVANLRRCCCVDWMKYELNLATMLRVCVAYVDVAH